MEVHDEMWIKQYMQTINLPNHFIYVIEIGFQILKTNFDRLLI